MRTMHLKMLFACLITLLTTTACGPSKEEIEARQPVCFSAEITTPQIMHKLYHPDDKNMPEPIFKAICSQNNESHDYKNAIGSATLLYDPTTHQLDYAIAFRGLSGPPILVELCSGLSGKEGRVIATLCNNLVSDIPALYNQENQGMNDHFHPLNPNESDHLEQNTASNENDYKAPSDLIAKCVSKNSGFLSDSIVFKENKDAVSSMSAEEVHHALLSDQLYINIITCLNEQGEVRGQIKKIMMSQKSMPGNNINRMSPQKQRQTN